MQDKVKLRHEFLARRLALPAVELQDKSVRMCSVFVEWIATKSFSEIFLFCPFRKEPDLTSLLAKVAGVRFGMPVVVSATDMKFYEVSAGTSYKPNKWGILEPQISASQQYLQPGEHGLIVMPALAVDRFGHRLGYGGGFYDRFLAKQKAAGMVAVFDEFIVERLPSELHDVRMNFVLTESGVGEC